MTRRKDQVLGAGATLHARPARGRCRTGVPPSAEQRGRLASDPQRTPFSIEPADSDPRAEASSPLNASETLQLNCPKCHGSVRVLTTSVGKRVRCPRCKAEFKVPGQMAEQRDDDDWLMLDDDINASAPAARPDQPAPSSPSSDKQTSNAAIPDTPRSPASGAPWASSQEMPRINPPEDEDDLDAFMLKSEELPPPAPPVKQPPSPKPQGKGGSGKGFSDADMQALDSILKQPQPAARQRPRKQSPAADDLADDDLVAESLQEEDAISEFRVTCPICTSITYVGTDQVGKRIKCSDCYSMITVPPPPKVRKGYSPDIEAAEVYAMVDTGEPAPVYGGPMAKSAAELLREAEEDSDDDPDRHDNYDNPDIKKWLAGIFGIYRDPSVGLHLLVLSLLGAVPGVAAAMIGHPGFAFFAAGLALLYFAFVLACGFSLLETVANGQKEVSEWPYMEPGEWLGRMLVAVAAASLAGGPAALLGGLVFGPSMAMVALTMFSLYLFFPFVLLSMLDSDSIFVPFSPEVSKSVSRCQESWGVLYLSSGLLFFGLLIFYVAINLLPPIATAVLASFATVGAIFTYFSMIGQLAYAIGQAVNAPPMKNNIDEIRARERAERAEQNV